MKQNLLFKLNMILIFIFLVCLGLVYARALLAPLTLAGLFALLILPIAQKLESFGINRKIASLICTFIVILIFISVASFFMYQLASFVGYLPKLKEQILSKLDKAPKFLNIKFVRELIQDSFISYIKSSILPIINRIVFTINNMFFAISNLIIAISLSVIYIFLLLSYRQKLISFLFKILPEDKHTEAKEVISQIRYTVSDYLIGLMALIFIFSVIYTLEFLIIGINYAFLLGALSGLLIIIPYLGTIIASVLPTIMAFFTPHPLRSVLLVLAFVTLNQFLEGNFLTPYILGSQVKVNPLIVFTFIIIGGMLWGIPGMILSVPLLGILKVIFDHMPSLKPYNILIASDEKR